MYQLHQRLTICSLTLLAGLFFLAAPALAVHPDESSKLENLKKRIEVLEGRQAAGTDEEAVAFGRIGEHVSLHGLLEVEAGYARPEGGDAASDLTLATAELSLEAAINGSIGGHLTLLYEEEEGEEDDIDVDEAVISLTAPGQPLGQTISLHVGRMYLPFGMFNSAMISDSLALDLGEAQDTAALVELAGEVWTFKAGAFNGDADTVGDNDNIDSWVAALDFTADENLGFGVSYISDLAESDIGLVQEETLYSGSVAGAGAYLSARCGRLGLEAEYLAALEDFDEALVAVGEDLTGPRPAAWNLELVWLATDRTQLAGRYEQAEDFQDDVRRYGATVSYGLHKHAVVALEYLRADARIAEDDPVHIVTAQLALEF